MPVALPQQAPDEPLRAAVAVDVGGVEERHAGVGRGVQRRHRGVLVDLAPVGADLPRAEADLGDSRPVGPRGRSASPGGCQSPAPAPPQHVGAALGPPVAGEDALLVAVGAEDARRDGEVGEVPDVLADDGVDAVEDAVGHLEQLGLVLLGPRRRGEAVHAGHGVGAVLGDDDRLAVLGRPGVELGLQPALGGGQVAGVLVPAVVAVEHHDVEEVGDDVALGGREHHVDEADGPGRVEPPRLGGERLEVGARLRRVGLGLVGDAPQHDAGVVLVARDELADRLAVDGLRGVIDGVRGEGRRVRGAEDAARDAHVEADRGGLVDHDDAVPVGVVEDLLGVGVVRGAERVRAEPVHQREVVDHEHVVVALAAHRAVLVLAEAAEVERLAVDQEARAVDLHRADADGERVGVDRRLASPHSSTSRSYR